MPLTLKRACEKGFSHKDNMIVVLAISDDNPALGRMAAQSRGHATHPEEGVREGILAQG
jgi:hypothetical protein